MENVQQERLYQRSDRGALSASTIFVAGVAIGSAVMYFLDPRAGAGRRAVARDKVGSTSTRSVSMAGKKFRHLRNQVEGLIATSQNWFRSTAAGAGDDTTIASRIRSKLGRVTPYVHSIAVDVHDGCVTLSGRVPEHEIDQVVSETRRVAGVREVVDHLARGEGAGAAASAEGPQTVVGS